MADNMIRFIFVTVFVLFMAIALTQAMTPNPIHMDPECGNRCIEAKLTRPVFFKCIQKCWENVVIRKHN